MECAKCKKQADLKGKTGDLCSKCFIEKIEKRARKQLWEYEFLRKRDRVLIVDDSSKEAAVNKYLFEKIIGGFPVEIVTKKLRDGKEIEKFVKKEKINRIVFPLDADDIADKKLNELLFGEKDKNDKKEIILLGQVLDKEVEEYARLKQLKFEKKEKKKDELSTGFDALEEKYHGAKFGFLKAIKELE